MTIFKQFMRRVGTCQHSFYKCNTKNVYIQFKNFKYYR